MEPEPTITSPTPSASCPAPEGLEISIAAVENALTAPADRAWVERVRVALGAVAAEFRLHQSAAQASDGTHRAVIRAEPRLFKAVADQVREQNELAAAIDDLLACLDSSDAVVPATDIRDRCRSLMDRLLRHRQRGADLLHEADQADIGGEG
jgi:hypothetical protein